MTCSIDITAIHGERDGTGRLSRVRAAGTSTGCLRIEIRINCLDMATGGVHEQAFLVDTAADGSWEAWFAQAALPACIACHRPLTVTATCLVKGDIVNPECRPASQTLSLPCPTEGCPEVRVTTYVSPACSADQRRNVVFSLTIEAPAAMAVRTELAAGDGTSYPVRSERRYSLGHSYDASRPGTFRPRVRIVSPTGCPDLELPLVTVSYCEALPPPPAVRCPRITRVVGIPLPAASGCEVLWISEIEPAAEGAFTWSFDGGAPLPPNRSRSALKRYGASGRHGVEVRFRPDATGCPESRMTGSTETVGCETGGRGGDEGGTCLFSRIAMVALLATAVAAAALATCLVPPQPWLVAAAVFAAAFTVLAIVWGLTCKPKPCNWFLLTTAQAFYAAGLILVNSIGCCPTLGYLGAAVAVAGLLMLVGWKESCAVSWCTFARELAFVTVGVLAQIFVLLGAFCGIPGFYEEPIPAVIWAIFNTMGIGFIAAGLGCSIARGTIASDALTDENLAPRFPMDG